MLFLASSVFLSFLLFKWYNMKLEQCETNTLLAAQERRVFKSVMGKRT